MKFEGSDFWKHKNGMDAFLYIANVVQDDNGKAIIHAYWMVQGTEHYWFCSDRERIFIKGDQYDNWESYEPTGKIYENA